MTPQTVRGRLQTVKAPPVPAEMATWQALYERRAALVAKVRFGNEAATNAKRFTDAARAKWGDELTAAQYRADEADLRDSFERDGVEAQHELELLDDEIKARPARGGPAPSKLLDRQRKPTMIKAVKAVKAYIAKPSARTGHWAWLCLCAVAGRVLRDSELDSLITVAQAWRAQDLERSGTMVAQHVVNSAAGREPTARLTRA